MRLARSAAAVALAVTALALTGCGPDEPVRDEETGEITESSESDVFALQVGDCMNSGELAEEVESVPTVPCSEPHDSEIFASTELEDGDYPGDDAIFDLADEFCLAEFETFIGVPYDESEIYYQPLAPSEMGWNELDDREVLCIALDETEGGITGSLEGAAR
ncbi:MULTISPECIES: septum formation family protein [unclassified Actinotalea]|uniref:septum formation family protein n=1 Tax=unclassified Actinotalea TaxID=2638618 RepID=UPI0015F71CD1|nr:MULTISPECIES: septum formation family protein [unclassified Actinotalea]